MFQRSDLGVITPFIHAIAPGVVEQLLTLGQQGIITDLDVTMAIEGTRLLEALCSRAKEETRMY